MIRGTTAQFKFELPCTKGELASATITFWQSEMKSEYLPIVKKIDDCAGSDDAKILYVSLTPSETLWFSDKYKAKVQLRAKKNDNTVFASHQQLITVYPINGDIAVDGEIEAAPIENGWTKLDGGTVII